ncbi:MAG: type VI secretion system contractile sheath large subunit [Vicinamibacterales bacterium]
MPAFQSVESIWRAVQWLVSTLELDETLELLLLHVTRDELGRGAGHGGDLWRRLVEREARAGDGLQASALLVGFTFGPGADDVATLQALGALGAALHAPVVAGASPACLGVSSVAAQPDPREWTPLDRDAEARWTTLRVQPAAAHLGLIAPRFLLRLPYGQKSDPVSAFRFEEQPPTPKHEWFLWGNSAFACGVVISRVLAPDVDLDSAGTLERLPAFVYTSDDESTLQAPAEIAPTEAAVIAIQSRGIMPIVSYKGRDDIRLVMLHSLASPPSDLLV